MFARNLVKNDIRHKAKQKKPKKKGRVRMRAPTPDPWEDLKNRKNPFDQTLRGENIMLHS